MLKFSHFDVKNVLSVGADIIEDQQSTIETLTAKVAFYEKEKRAIKLAEIMEDKGLNSNLSYEEKIDSLMNHANLDVVEEALDMEPARLAKVATLDNQGTSTESYLRMIQ
jgi:hypothetical protein